jgi:hypothetical protein
MNENHEVSRQIGEATPKELAEHRRKIRELEDSIIRKAAQRDFVADLAVRWTSELPNEPITKRLILQLLEEVAAEQYLTNYSKKGVGK